MCITNETQTATLVTCLSQHKYHLWKYGVGPAPISLPATTANHHCVYMGLTCLCCVVVVNCKDPTVKVHLHGAVFMGARGRGKALRVWWLLRTPQTYFQVITKAREKLGSRFAMDKYLGKVCAERTQEFFLCFIFNVNTSKFNTMRPKFGNLDLITAETSQVKTKK